MDGTVTISLEYFDILRHRSDILNDVEIMLDNSLTEDGRYALDKEQAEKLFHKIAGKIFDL